MRTPEIMAEVFARGLVDKIMVEVLNVIERDTQDGKSWEQRVDEETSDGQSELVHRRSQEHVHRLVNCCKTDEMELIAQIVRDLRDIQIGDSCYVLPPSLLALEKQADLSGKDVEKAEFAFSIYDTDGTNVIDAVDLGNVLRALNLNPTNATIEKLGGTKKKGEKKMKVDEFLPIFSQCKKDKEQGCYEDFLECLKLYDKQENGMMLGAELSHTLLSLGERLSDEECDQVLKDCMDPEDDDGFIPYAPFLKKMMVPL